MIGIHSVEQIRAAEQEYMAAHPQDDLMQIAAQWVTTRAEQMTDEPGFILVAVGPGHNGGDGLFAARNLARAGRQVVVWLVTGRAHAQGVVAARQAGIRFIDSVTVMRMLPDIALVIDAIIGLGARPGLPEKVNWFAEACQTLSIPVLAVDLPSGLTADHHERSLHHMNADVTITFAAPKLCHLAQPAASCCGAVEIADVGLNLPDAELRQMQRVDVARWWPWPTPYADKYSRGVLGIDTGSDRYPGAAVLSVIGALYSGVGMVRYTGPQRAADFVLGRQPSVTYRGRGMPTGWFWLGNRERTRTLRQLESGPMIIDAEAWMTCLKSCLRDGCSPHARVAIKGITRPRWWTIRSDRRGSPPHAGMPQCCSRVPPSMWQNRAAPSPWRCPGRPGQRRPDPATCWPVSAGRCWRPACPLGELPRSALQFRRSPRHASPARSRPMRWPRRSPRYSAIWPRWSVLRRSGPAPSPRALSQPSSGRAVGR